MVVKIPSIRRLPTARLQEENQLWEIEEKNILLLLLLLLLLLFFTMWMPYIILSNNFGAGMPNA